MPVADSPGGIRDAERFLPLRNYEGEITSKFREVS